jgi:hypothetical protein
MGLIVIFKELFSVLLVGSVISVMEIGPVIALVVESVFGRY